jgi:hypothetical protein
MKFVIKTSYHEESGIGYVLVDITPELVRIILERKRMFKDLYFGLVC